MWKNFKRVKFWRIAVDKAIIEDYLSESDDRFSVVSLYLQVQWTLTYLDFYYPAAQIIRTE